MEHVGRLEMPHIRPHKAKAAEEWCTAMMTSTVIEGVIKKKVAIRELLRISPKALTPTLEDRHVGTCNAMQFGLIPARIQSIIEDIGWFR